MSPRRVLAVVVVAAPFDVVVTVPGTGSSKATANAECATHHAHPSNGPAVGTISVQCAGATLRFDLDASSAVACLERHGATTASYTPCAAEVDRNEADSPEYARMLKEAQPRFDAARRCFEEASGVTGPTLIDDAHVAPGKRARVAAALEQCFRPDGLPR